MVEGFTKKIEKYRVLWGFHDPMWPGRIAQKTRQCKLMMVDKEKYYTSSYVLHATAIRETLTERNRLILMIGKCTIVWSRNEKSSPSLLVLYKKPKH